MSDSPLSQPFKIPSRNSYLELQNENEILKKVLTAVVSRIPDWEVRVFKSELREPRFQLLFERNELTLDLTLKVEPLGMSHG